MLRVRALARLCLLIAYGAQAMAQEGNYEPLFDGSLNGWSIENAEAGSFAVAGGVLRVAEPRGWLRFERALADFRLRIEFRFLSVDADSGIFLRALADTRFGRGWPGSSYQVQLRNPLGESPFPPVGGLFRHGMPPGATEFDPELAAELSRGTGEWQALEIEVVGDELGVWLNGRALTRARDRPPFGLPRHPGRDGAPRVSRHRAARALSLGPRLGIARDHVYC